jgi:hypothetical protein
VQNMPTIVVTPPAPDLRMLFMDAMEADGIDYDRNKDGYWIYLRESQVVPWTVLISRFSLIIEDTDPPAFF